MNIARGYGRPTDAHLVRQSHARQVVPSAYPAPQRNKSNDERPCSARPGDALRHASFDPTVREQAAPRPSVGIRISPPSQGVPRSAYGAGDAISIPSSMSRHQEPGLCASAPGNQCDPLLLCGVSQGDSASLFSREQVGEAHGAVLKALREDSAGLSQEQLGEGTETDRTYVSLQERGLRSPNLWVFLKNAHALGVDPVLMLSMVLARLRGQ